MLVLGVFVIVAMIPQAAIATVQPGPPANNQQVAVAPFPLADGKVDIVSIYVYPADQSPGNVPLDYHSSIYGTSFPLLGSWLAELRAKFGEHVPVIGRARSTGWYRLPKNLEAYYLNTQLNPGLLFADALEAAKSDVRFKDYDAFVVQAWGIGNSMGGRWDDYVLPDGVRRDILMSIMAAYPDMRDLGTVAHEVLGHALFGWPHSGVLGANSVYSSPDDLMSGSCQQGPGVVPNHPVYGCYATLTTSYNLYLSDILPVANVETVYLERGQPPTPFALQCLYAPLGAKAKALWLQVGMDDFWFEARCPETSRFEAWLSGHGIRVYQLMPGEGYLGQSEARLVVPDPRNPRAPEGWYQPGNAFDQVNSHEMLDTRLRVCVTAFADDTYRGWFWRGGSIDTPPECVPEV